MQRRLWTVGSLEHGLIPSEAYLNDIVKMIEDDSITDLVFGPDVKMQIIDDSDDLELLEKLNEN